MAPDHLCRVFGSPWRGVHGTHIESKRHYGKHWHESYGLGLLEQGAQKSASGRGDVQARAGDLITTNPGEVHDGHPIGGASRRWRMVYLDPDVIASMAGNLEARAPGIELTCPVIEDPRLVRALQHLFTDLDDWNAGSRPIDVKALACEESLADTVALLLSQHATTTPLREGPGNVRRVRDRLADDPLAAPTLGEMAAMAGLSKYQLLRRFRQTYGVPPHAWLVQHRAERARGLIRGGCPLVLAAASCGFADQSHMTRIFVRQFGFTPGAWQRATAPTNMP